MGQERQRAYGAVKRDDLFSWLRGGKREGRQSSDGVKERRYSETEDLKAKNSSHSCCRTWCLAHISSFISILALFFLFLCCAAASCSLSEDLSPCRWKSKQSNFYISGDMSIICLLVTKEWRRMRRFSQWALFFLFRKALVSKDDLFPMRLNCALTIWTRTWNGHK